VYCTGQVAVFWSNLLPPYLTQGILPLFHIFLPNYTMSCTGRSQYCNWTLWGPEISFTKSIRQVINPLKAQLNPTFHLLAILGAHHILHVGSIRVNCNMRKGALRTVPSKSFVAVSIGFMEMFAILSIQVGTRNDIFLALLFQFRSNNYLPIGVNVGFCAFPVIFVQQSEWLICRLTLWRRNYFF